MQYVFWGNAAGAPPKTAAAIAAGALLLAGILAYAPWDEHRHLGDWLLDVLSALLDGAFAHVADFTITPTGNIGHDGGRLDQAIAVDTFDLSGRTYAVVASYHDDAVQIIDVTDPSNLDTVDVIDDNDAWLELDGASGVAVFTRSGNTYAAVSAYEDDGVQILDVTDPSNITPVGRITEGGSRELDGPRGIAIFERSGSTYAAVAAHEDDGVQVLDVTDPTNPTAVGQINNNNSRELNGARGIAIFEHSVYTYAAVASDQDDAVQILNLTDPTSPEAVSRLTNNNVRELNGASSIAVFELPNRTYGAVASFNDDGVQIINLTDPNRPWRLGRISDNAAMALDGARGIDTFDISGKVYAVVAAAADRGVQILNVTNPSAQPVAVGSITDDATLLLSGANAVDIFERSGRTYAAVTAYNDNGTQVIDITNPASPAAAGQLDDDYTRLNLDTANSVTVFEHSGRTYGAVGANTKTGIQVLDLTNPSNIVPAGKIGSGSAEFDNIRGIQIFEHAGRIYGIVAAQNIGSDVQLFDLTTSLSNPTLVSQLSDNSTLFLDGAGGAGIFETSGRLYAAFAGYNDDGIQIVDMTNPSNMVPVGQISDTPSLLLDAPIGIAVFERSDRVYGAVLSRDNPGIQILDLTDPSNPVGVGQIANSPTVLLDGLSNLNFFESSGRLYAAVNAISGTSGIQILDLTDPANPTAAGQVADTADLNLDQPYGFGIFEISGRIYGAATSYGDHGVQVLDLTNPASPTAIAKINDDHNLELRGAAHISIFERSNNIYAAVAGFNNDGVQILRLDWPNSLPTADAGPDQSVIRGNTVTLSGTASDHDGDPLTYRWTHNSTLAISLTDDAALSPTFTAPSISDTTTIKFALTVTDHHGSSVYDTVLITVVHNRPPVVDAGPDQTVDEGDTVTLAGTATDHEGDPLTYLWTYRPASPAVALADDAALSTTFTAPPVSAETTITFTLTVRDGNNTVSDTTAVTVRNVANQLPVVDAGPDRTVNEGDTVTLTGSATDHEGDPLTYSWSCDAFPRSPAVSIDLGASSSRLSANFTAPMTVNYTTPLIADDTLAFTCTLTATDPYGYASDQMTLIVLDVPEDRPVLSVVGDRSPIVARGSAWTDPGATCVTKLDGTPLPITTTISVGDFFNTKVASVDTSLPGFYRVTYSCEHNGQSATAFRAVRIIDSDKRPDIGIVSVRTTIGPDGTAVDYSSDAHCRDREDGNPLVTSSVTFRDDGRTATITYSCTDSGGRTTTTTQEVVVLSSAPPEIYLNRPGIHYMNAGDTWADPGAYCVDAEDGRIPAPMTRTSLDTATPGHYRVFYACTDSDGNSEGTIRNVFVQSARQNLPPVLSISDRSDITIRVNGTWSVPSATCTDKEDGDLTSLIWMWGVDAVDVTKPGVYSFTYFCTDSGDEEAQTTMRVKVIEP